MLRYFQERYLNGKRPKEFCMDDSSALLLATVIAYTSFETMIPYSDSCFDALFEGSEPPSCYIRLDRSHFVKSILRSKALQQIDKEKRKFYQRLMGYLMLADNIGDADRVIENMFILLKNQYLYDERALQAKDELVMIAKYHKHIINENNPENYIEMHDIEEDRIIDSKTKSKFYKWIHKVIKKVDKNFVNYGLNNSYEETDADLNPYTSNQLVKPLIKILSRIHLFSNVMNTTVGSKNVVPTSSCTEAQFRNIKSYMFNGKKGIRLDAWLERSIEITDGNFKALVAEAKETKKAKRRGKSEKRVTFDQQGILDSINNDSLNGDITNFEEPPQKRIKSSRSESKKVLNNVKKSNIDDDYRPLEEDWSLQNVDAKKPHNKNHVREPRVHRKYNSIINIENPGHVPVPLLLNGGKSRQTDDIPVIFSTVTCSFDAIFQLIKYKIIKVKHPLVHFYD